MEHFHYFRGWVQSLFDTKAENTDTTRNPFCKLNINGENSILTILLRKYGHTNLPPARFELRSLGPQAGVLPIELPLHVAYILDKYLPPSPLSGLFSMPLKKGLIK